MIGLRFPSFIDKSRQALLPGSQLQGRPELTSPCQTPVQTGSSHPLHGPFCLQKKLLVRKSQKNWPKCTIKKEPVRPAMLFRGHCTPQSSHPPQPLLDSPIRRLNHRLGSDILLLLDSWLWRSLGQQVICILSVRTLFAVDQVL